MTNKPHNGWTNYETWNCNLWFDNYFSEQALELWGSLNDGNSEETKIDKKIEAVARLAEAIKETITGEDFAPKAEGFHADMLNAAYREVNYSEIAQHYIDDIAD